MASYRNISMDFWTDSKVVDDFTPEDRYIYLYCMTNPHTNLCGCYEVSIKQIANETGYNNDSVERLLKRLDIVQHRAQREYFKAHELDVIILGRRRADGNYVGRNSNIYTDGKGVTRFSPLAAWKHEHILAYIHYHQLPLPPIYGWKNGYLCGTHPWPARQWTGSIENGWREVYDIDPGIVLAAAEKIDSARAFLKEVQA